MEKNQDRLVPAAVFTSAGAANIALGMLRTNGIPCILDGEIANNVFGIQLSPSDGIRLMVHAKDLPTATELLRECGDE